MSVAIRDKTTAANQLAIASDGSIIATIKGNGAPPSRSMDYWTVDQFSFAATTDTLLTVTESVNGAATSTFTTRVVTNGKTLRLTSISVSVENGGTVPILSRVYVGIRFNTGGAVTTASPLVYRVGVSVAATAKAITDFFAELPDGMEFAGDGTKQIGITAICPDYAATTQLPKLTLGIMAYEY